MSEFKFACPNCRQHLLCDTSYAGSQITCPLCQQAIVVPQPPAKGSSRGLWKALAVSGIVIVVCAALGVGGWYGWHLYSQHKMKSGNPETEVPAPSAASAMQALSILTRVHSAYTNITSVKADGTLAVFLNLTNITLADVSPKPPADAKAASRRPPGMPRFVTNATEFSMKRSQTNLYYLISGEAVTKIDAQTMSNTFAFWKSDQGQFMFTDMHQKMIPPMYRQLPDTDAASDQMRQFQNMQHLFEDPANLAKIAKNLGQTEDESVDGQDCYTLTAKVLGQKVKVWVDKSANQIAQWQITLGGKLSDADIDDAFSLVASAFTNIPPAQLDMIKTQVKKFAPVTTKIRGTITFTSQSVETNPTLAASDFNYPVPRGVRLVTLNAASASPRTSQNARRNACINNLRQIDAAKNEFALEKGKKNGDAVTEDDIKPYIKLSANGNLPKCPDGGKYTIGKIGEKPTCSIPGHELP